MGWNTIDSSAQLMTESGGCRGGNFIRSTALRYQMKSPAQDDILPQIFIWWEKVEMCFHSFYVSDFLSLQQRYRDCGLSWTNLMVLEECLHACTPVAWFLAMLWSSWQQNRLKTLHDKAANSFRAASVSFWFSLSYLTWESNISSNLVDLV